LRGLEAEEGTSTLLDLVKAGKGEEDSPYFFFVLPI
jgi:hypothetical protein